MIERDRDVGGDDGEVTAGCPRCRVEVAVARPRLGELHQQLQQRRGAPDAVPIDVAIGDLELGRRCLDVAGGHREPIDGSTVITWSRANHAGDSTRS